MRRACLALLGTLIALYMVSVALGALVPRTTAQLDQSPKTAEILLIGGVIHYDFLLPLNDVTRARLGWLTSAGIEMDHPEAKWLVVGWGARDFYTATGGYADLRADTIWRGLTGDSSVMRIDLSGQLDDLVDPLTVALSDAQYAALLDQIEGSFALGAATPALKITGLSGFDRFFEAKGRFNFFKTCNVWIGQSLRAAGVQFGVWTPLPISVRLSHYLHQGRQTQKP